VTTYARMRQEAGRRRIDAKVRAGELVRVRRGVYTVRGVCPSVATAAAHGGVIACTTAARHIGLWVLHADDTVHVWMTGRGHRYAHPGCTCVEHWDSAADEAPLTAPSVPRILRQILTCHGVEAFFVALESALHQGMLDARGRAWLESHTTAAARDAIAFARDDAESGLESLLRWRLRPHGLSLRTQVVIPTRSRVDFLIGDRLLVEVDGRQNHDGPSMRHKDLVRDADAATWGYVTLRFDYAMVVHDWELVEAAILAQVVGARPSP